MDMRVRQEPALFDTRLSLSIVQLLEVDYYYLYQPTKTVYKDLELLQLCNLRRCLSGVSVV